jgi:hypothetical protein
LSEYVLPEPVLLPIVLERKKHPRHYGMGCRVSEDQQERWSAISLDRDQLFGFVKQEIAIQFIYLTVPRVRIKEGRPSGVKPILIMT